MGNVLIKLVEKNDSNGAFSLLEAILVPGNEPPPHVHTREDEHFYVLEGEFDGYVEEDAFNLNAGESIFLPRFQPHAFVIRFPRLRVLVLFTPGGLEEAFRKMSSPAHNLEPPTGALKYAQSDLEQTAQRFARYGARFLTPDEAVEQMPLYPRSPSSQNVPEPTRVSLQAERKI